MKTAGILLQEKRLEKELTLEQIATKIKVKAEYLKALEDSDFSVLPSSTFTKGFLQNYARVLHINPETILAMFRRDFVEVKGGKIVPRGMENPVSGSPRIISANLILVGILLTAFLGFLGLQVYTWLRLPKLNVLQPVNGEIYVSKVTIKGTTDIGAVITINNQTILVDQSGHFSLDLLFPEGTHALVVQAKNREGKVRLVERTFQVTK